MAEIIGAGLTHFPLMLSTREMARILERTLEYDGFPAEWKDPKTWPEPMQEEWRHKEVAEANHRARHLRAFRQIRTAIDEFKPDLVLIWGDDQYENFREPIIPPFCIYIFDEMTSHPFHRLMGGGDNIWGVPPEFTYTVRGHRKAAKELTTRLLEAGFDVPYAYQASHEQGLGHAHVNTLVYLDMDRTGFDYPVIPFAVNCYGSSVIAHHGSVKYLNPEVEPDPPSPSPRRCFELGQAVARILHESPYRTAVIASSSWSHAFLTDKNRWLYPDTASDRARFEDLQTGRFDRWRDLTVADIEDAGQQEFLNWVCLAGAMTELGYKAEVLDYLESYIFNSDKAFALFRA